MASKSVLIYGGSGALGSKCVSIFKSKSFWVGSIDLLSNEEADANIIIKNVTDWKEQENEVSSKTEVALAGRKLDGIFCVAGGWAGGNAAASDVVKNSDLMWKQSVWSSVIAAHLASKHLTEGGLLQLTGAQPALCGTPGMIGYGMAKAAVHQLVYSLSENKSGLPQNSTTLAILPVTLDTPMNRKFMPNADHSKWTPLEFVGNLFCDWLEKKELPKSGSLVQLITTDGETKLVASECCGGAAVAATS